MKRNGILNSHGFTLVEIMVSVGLLAIVSMSLINLYDFFSKTVRKTNADHIVEEIETKITYLVTDKIACDYTLAGRTIPIEYIDTSAAGTSINIRDYSNNIVLSENDIFNFASLGGPGFLPRANNIESALVRVNKIYAHEFNQINTQEYETLNWENYNEKISGYRKGFVRLSIVFDLRDIKPDGSPTTWGRTIVKDILLGVVLERQGTGDTVVECSDYKDTAMATSIKNICDDLDGTITYNAGQMFCAGTQQSLLRELRLRACRYLPFYAVSDGRGYARDCIPNTHVPVDTCNGQKFTGIAHFEADGIRHHIFTCKNWPPE
jgi:prepilin-type N-terminal cleavage/methylation domain-containing protein